MPAGAMGIIFIIGCGFLYTQTVPGEPLFDGLPAGVVSFCSQFEEGIGKTSGMTWPGRRR